MAFSAVTLRGSAVSNASGTTLAVSPSANIVVGKIAFAVCGSDNDATTDSDTTFHTVTDSVGNTWTRLKERTETDGAVNDGSTASIWWTKVGTQIGTGNSVTLTLGAAKTDKLIVIFEATVGSGNSIALEQAGTGQNESATVSGMTSREYLLIGWGVSEGEDNAKTPDADYTELYDNITSATGALDVNIAAHLQTRIATLTGDTVTSTAWTFTNAVTILAAVYEVAPTTYNESRTESVAAADSVGGGIGTSNPLSESVTGADSASATQVLVESTSENVAAAAVEASAQVTSNTQTESLTAGESASDTLTMEDSLGNDVTAGDSVVNTQVMNAAVTEGVTAADSAAASGSNPIVGYGTNSGGYSAAACYGVSPTTPLYHHPSENAQAGMLLLGKPLYTNDDGTGAISAASTWWSFNKTGAAADRAMQIDGSGNVINVRFQAGVVFGYAKNAGDCNSTSGFDACYNAPDDYQFWYPRKAAYRNATSDVLIAAATQALSYVNTGSVIGTATFEAINNFQHSYLALTSCGSGRTRRVKFVPWF